MIVVSCCVAIKDIMMGGFSACFGRLLIKIILHQMGPFPVAGHIYIERNKDVGDGVMNYLMVSGSILCVAYS